MEIALADAGILHTARPPISIPSRDRRLGHPFFPDLLVDEDIVIELKSVEEFHPVHFRQLMSYMRMTGRCLGSLVNFNVERLSAGIKRRVLG